MRISDWSSDVCSSDLGSDGPPAWRGALKYRQFALVAAGSVDAAFHLVPAAPASGARIFARLHHAGARRAADRQISLGLQRMARQIMFGEIGVQPGLVPVGKGIDLQPPVLDLETAKTRAGAALKDLE